MIGNKYNKNNGNIKYSKNNGKCKLNPIFKAINFGRRKNFEITH